MPNALMAGLVIETEQPVTEGLLDDLLYHLARALDGTGLGSVEFCSTPEPTTYREDDDYDVGPTER
jgi:hypothetical protein